MAKGDYMAEEFLAHYSNVIGDWFAGAGPIILGVIVIGVIVLFFYLRKKGKISPEYKIKVIRQFVTNTGIVTKFDKCRFVSDEDNPAGYYELEKTKERFPAPNYGDFIDYNTLNILTTNRGENFPVRMVRDKNDKGEFMRYEPVMDESTKILLADEYKQIFMKYLKDKWWMQYLGLIIVVVSGILIMIMAWTVVGKVNESVGAISGACSTVSTTCAELAKNCQYTLPR